MFAGSQKIVELLKRGDIEQSQVDERIDLTKDTDSKRKSFGASDHHEGQSAHRSKHYKSNPVNPIPAQAKGSKRKACSLGVIEIPEG